MHIEDSQEIMVGLAFTMPFETRQFELFHVCLQHIDATADSNKEGRPLVTLSSKELHCNMFLVLRAFLPTEQSWAFQWLFQTACPAFLGKEVMRKSILLSLMAILKKSHRWIMMQSRSSSL